METAVILEGARTPIGKFLGGFSELPTVELGVLAVKEALRRANVEPDQVEQTILGHARQAGNGPNTGRQVSVKSGIPVEVPAFNVNMACASGMKAVHLGAQQIMTGEAEVVVVGGMENMTRVPFLLDRMRFGYRLGDATVYDAMYMALAVRLNTKLMTADDRLWNAWRAHPMLAAHIEHVGIRE